MSARMLTAKETLSSLAEPRSREQVAADRIARRMVSAAMKGTTDYRPRAGFFGVNATLHEAGVYADVAGQLLEEGVAIEAHRYNKKTFVLPPEGVVPIECYQVRDVLSVMSVHGEPVERKQTPQDRDGHIVQLYPPPGQV